MFWGYWKMTSCDSGNFCIKTDWNHMTSYLNSPYHMTAYLNSPFHMTAYTDNPFFITSYLNTPKTLLVHKFFPLKKSSNFFIHFYLSLFIWMLHSFNNKFKRLVWSLRVIFKRFYISAIFRLFIFAFFFVYFSSIHLSFYFSFLLIRNDNFLHFISLMNFLNSGVNMNLKLK